MQKYKHDWWNFFHGLNLNINYLFIICWLKWEDLIHNTWGVQRNKSKSAAVLVDKLVRYLLHLVDKNTSKT